jgi:hypothetical protein
VEPYLRKILTFIGIGSVQTVRAEGMNIAPCRQGRAKRGKGPLRRLLARRSAAVYTIYLSMPASDAEELCMTKAQYEVFEALNPFFGVVREGLRGLIDEVHGKILSNGADYDNRLISAVTIENRKIVYRRDYVDSLATWTALNGPYQS